MKKPYNEKNAAKERIIALVEHLKGTINVYETLYDEKYPIKILENYDYDYINPSHYVQNDGRQTWERMLDHWTPDELALWCEMTVFKYQDRAGKKPNEDIERETSKIKWYTEKAKELRSLKK